MNFSLSAFLLAIFGILKDNAIGTALPIINQAIQNIISNPGSALNIQAQLLGLEANLLAALPNMEASDIKALATLVQTTIAALGLTPATPAA